jgi:hypothetical protein
MSPQEFENDVCEFNKRVEDLDRRLGTILIQAFDDAPDVEHAFKVSANEAEVSPMCPHLASEDSKCALLIPSGKPEGRGNEHI